MKSKIKLTVILLLLWLVGLLVFHFKFSYQEIFVKEIPKVDGLFTDSIYGGSSTCSSEIVGDTIIFDYNLTQTRNIYSQVSYRMKFNKVVDISGYDDFEYTLKGSAPNTLVLSLQLAVPGDTLYPLRYLHCFKEYGKNYHTYKLPLKQFEYSEPWMRDNELREADLGEIDLRYLESIVFESGQRQEYGRKERIEFHSLKFTKTVHWPYYVFVLSLLFLLGYWWLSGKKLKKNETVLLNYIPVKELQGDEFSSVIHYIAKNYMKPNLSASFICETLGISDDKLNTEIKKVSTLTFKPFLNQIRIEEAKRLLLETNSRVAEISEMVGYENVTHFNRVFKKEVLMTPSSFRKQGLEG